MGRFLTVTNSNETRSGFRKDTIKKEIVIGPNAIKFVTIAIFAILAIVYLSQSTAGANRGIKISELSEQKTNLELKKERLEVEKYRLESLSQIDSGIEKPELEPTAN